MIGMAVHGGAGRSRGKRRKEVKEGILEATERGLRVLRSGGDAVSAVEEAVKALEDNPVFNAGTGSVLTLDGRCEMDAAIMRGSTLEAGAVAGIEKIKNPISLARKVMEETDHVLLAGEGAQQFARIMGFEEYDPVTERRLKEWRKWSKKVKEGEPIHWKKIAKLLRRYPEILRGTVGAVALDSKGELAVATSTGGALLKLFGRIGDTPVLGAGTYATPIAAVSATGIGEGIMRTLLAKTVCDFIRMGLTPEKACQAGIDLINQTVKTSAGVIAVDSLGRTGYAFNTAAMPTALYSSEREEILIVGFKAQ